MKYFKERFTLQVIIVSIVFSGCGHSGYEALKTLDRDTRKYDSLFQFSTFDKSRKEINNIKVCNVEFSECEEDEVDYALILSKNDIPLNKFNDLVAKMGALGYRTFYRHNDYSLWVQGGSMGNIFGYLIDHHPNDNKMESFRLNDFYFIEIGNKVDKGVYYFTGN